MIIDDKNPMFSTEPIVDVMALAWQNGEADLKRRRIEFNRKRSEIAARYDSEARKTDFWFPRLEYTPKQLKRIRKQTNKWHRRLLGKF